MPGARYCAADKKTCTEVNRSVVDFGCDFYSFV